MLAWSYLNLLYSEVLKILRVKMHFSTSLFQAFQLTRMDLGNVCLRRNARILAFKLRFFLIMSFLIVITR